MQPENESQLRRWLEEECPRIEREQRLGPTLVAPWLYGLFKRVRGGSWGILQAGCKGTGSNVRVRWPTP